MNKALLFLTASISISLAAWAQEKAEVVAVEWSSEPVEVVEVVSIQAPVDKVWDTVKGFDQLHTWHPMFVTTELVEGEATVPGAVRVLTLKDDGGEVKETLTSYDEEAKTYAYIITESPMTIKEYAASIAVTDAGDGVTTVEWKGKFMVPVEGGDEVTAAIREIYSAGLDALKIHLEGA
jgi:carbon monoxide dehydrogenase subunit G